MAPLQKMQSELDIITEKIEVFESMLKGSKGEINSYASRKLAYYKDLHAKLIQNQGDAIVEEGATAEATSIPSPEMREPTTDD